MSATRQPSRHKAKNTKRTPKNSPKVKKATQKSVRKGGKKTTSTKVRGKGGATSKRPAQAKKPSNKATRKKRSTSSKRVRRELKAEKHIDHLPIAEGVRPHHERSDWSLYCDDCLEILYKLPAESADLIFADPPYGLSNDGMSVHSGKRVSVNKGNWDKTRGPKGDRDFHREWIAGCHRALKDDGTLWISGSMHSIYLCGAALQLGGWRILNEIIWYKPNATPHLAGRMFAHSHETLIWARKSEFARHYFDYELMKKSFYANEEYFKKQDRQMRSVWAINTPAKGEKHFGKHPAQKPEKLLQRIILACTEQGQLVLDPFCGSATTGVAALREGRKFIGIDNEKSYLNKYAIPRLEEEERKIA